MLVIYIKKMQHRLSQKKYFKSKYLLIFLLILTVIFISSIYLKIQKIDFKTSSKSYNFLGKELLIEKNL